MEQQFRVRRTSLQDPRAEPQFLQDRPGCFFGPDYSAARLDEEGADWWLEELRGDPRNARYWAYAREPVPKAS